MSTQQRRTPISTAVLSETTITQIIIGITFALILVEFWRIFLEALIFSKLGINKNSAYQTLIVAVALTFILIIIINFVQAPANDLIVGIDTPTSTTSRTQEFLVGPSAIVTPADRCDCRNCTSSGDRLNPVNKNNSCINECHSRRGRVYHRG